MTDSEPDVALVRLLIADEDAPPNQLFGDAKLQSFLQLEGSNIKLAAAQALETIATSEVLVSKVIKTQDLSTDGAKVAAQLSAQAKALREQVATEKDAADEGYFDVVNVFDDDWRCW